MSWFGWEKLFNGDMPRDIELFQSRGLDPAARLSDYRLGAFRRYRNCARASDARPRLHALHPDDRHSGCGDDPARHGFQLSTVWIGVFAYLSAHGIGRWALDRPIDRQV
ncbi:hypothetical protein MYG64_25345 (plasmid) [Ensifer adhaerens]|nr:hypothetical protein [Ensifer adhaerens]UTV39067.1 hypothetical protein MYG64_25345 [Ensifer adhaerens]